MSKDPTFLDVEDEEQRQKRIGTLLERLNITSPSSSVSPNPLLNIGHERSPGPIEPPTELLARVQTFLPAISASNEALSQENPQDIDIENVPEDAEQYIEMNLGLGVFEAKRRPESGSRSLASSLSSDAESTSDVTSTDSESDPDSSSSSSQEDSDSGSGSDSDSSSSDDSDVESQSGSSVDLKPISSRPIKPLPRRVSQQVKLDV